VVSEAPLLPLPPNELAADAATRIAARPTEVEHDGTTATMACAASAVELKTAGRNVLFFGTSV